jgi:hypothetical protein
VITSLEIENFRCFKKLRLEGLSRVNLIVGANNSGKTVLLEAIEAVRNPFLLDRASIERGEHRERRVGEKLIQEVDPRHWFHGHRLTRGANFSVRATGKPEFSVSLKVESAPPTDAAPVVSDAFQLILEHGGTPLVVRRLSDDGWLQVGGLYAFDLIGLRMQPPVGFVTTDHLLPRKLAQLWTNVVLTPGELHTVDALRLVEPSLERIAISESDGPSAKVLLRGEEGPVPLGTLGEGVTRMLALALHLVRTEGGHLLIDEIENGLHWSVMPKVWRFLIETARARDVQVFATTHSKDWLEGLAALHRTDPELAANVSVHRLEAGRETSVRFDAGRIAEYVEMELEAR